MASQANLANISNRWRIAISVPFACAAIAATATLLATTPGTPVNAELGSLAFVFAVVGITIGAAARWFAKPSE